MAMSREPDLFSVQRPHGHALVGREVLVCWDDGVWYDAVVVCYFEKDDEYKLVYRADDGIEIACLRNRRWLVAPKKLSTPKRPVLDGAIVEFLYPKDGIRYQAMIYDYSHRGERLKIAYLDEHTTDHLKGGGWDFISPSPCSEDPDKVNEHFDDDVLPLMQSPTSIAPRESKRRVISKRRSTRKTTR